MATFSVWTLPFLAHLGTFSALIGQLLYPTSKMYDTRIKSPENLREATKNRHVQCTGTPQSAASALNSTLRIDRLNFRIPFPLQFSRLIAYNFHCVTGRPLFSIALMLPRLRPVNFVAQASLCCHSLLFFTSVTGYWYGIVVVEGVLYCAAQVLASLWVWRFDGASVVVLRRIPVRVSETHLLLVPLLHVLVLQSK